MDNNIPEIEELIKQFSRLPGLGPKSAKRIILKLINNKESLVKPLAQSLSKVYKNVVRCINCGNLKILDKQCICESENKFDKICVVENLADMWVIESANIYKGYYHIHSEKGPMVGNQHTKLKHEYLIPINNSGSNYQNETSIMESERENYTDASRIFGGY